VVWYSGIATTLDVRQLPNGDLFIPLTTNFVEVNMLGETVQTWNVPADWAINFHDGVPTDHGTILYLNDASRVVANFPTSSTNPNAPLATTDVQYNRVVEISATDSTRLNNWSLIDMLQPTRIDYLTFTIGGPLGWDCEHANAVIEDPRDNSIIVSLRHQDAIIKFSRATGQLKWILGPHENWGPQFQQYLLTPVGTPFEWNYGQHAPMITPQGTLLVYDDGNFWASPFDPGLPDASNYSRAVEYDINEQTMGVSQVWDYGRTNAEQLFTDRVGNADWLPQSGNVLITFGNVDYVNGVHPSLVAPKATMLRVKEVTHNQVPEVVFDLAVFDYGNTNSSYLGTFAYRSHRIPDLYTHPAQPVADLRVRYESGMPRLEFSADSTRTYTIEASTDLVNWSAIGEPAEESDGDFSFLDAYAADLPSRYYRVITR
jgi:arylsulfate sulfotransferase